MSKIAAIMMLGAAAGGYYLYQDNRNFEQNKRREMQRMQAAQQWEAAHRSSGRKAGKFAPLLEWGLGEFMHIITGNGKRAGTGTSAGGKAPKSGGGGYVAPSLGNGNIGRRLMADLMRDFGLTRAQAAGIVGNLDHESGGFRTLQEINPTVRGSRGGYGYAQWTGPRRRAFEKWARANGLDMRSYEANYGFLKYELTSTSEKRAIAKIRRTTNPTDAAIVFEDSFLRAGIPHLSSRIKRAQKWAEV